MVRDRYLGFRERLQKFHGVEMHATTRDYRDYIQRPENEASCTAGKNIKESLAAHYDDVMIKV
jgi:hypothetical protein